MTPPLPVAPAVTVSAIVAVRVRPPPVPVTVSVAAPTVAVAEALRVSTLDAPVDDAGLNEAVTPLGRPDTVNATALAKLFTRVIATVLVPLAPLATDTAAGLADKLKSGVVELTVRLIAVVRTVLPLVPVIVTLAVPVVAAADAVSVRTTLLPVVEVGLNDAVTPLGRPLAVNAMLPVNAVRAILIVLVTLALRLTDTLLGLGDKLKSVVAVVVSP